MVKSIIDIQVDDASFRRFNQLFQQYQKQLKATPLAWKDVALAQAGGVKGFRDLVREQVAAIGKAKLLEQANKAALEITKEQESVFRRMQRTTAGVATNIRDITGSLLQWGKVTGIVSGLIGAGGLFGVTRLAQEVAGGRRQAMGQGTSYGEQKAFGVNFSRVVDTDSVLGGVNAALTNVQNRVNLYNAGLKEGELGGGAGAVSVRLLNRLKGLADQTPDNLLGNVHAARGLGNVGISPEDFQRLKRMSREELATLTTGYNRDQGGLDVTNQNQRVYQDFATQISRAGQQIENVFVKGLAPLIPGIGKLSESVVKGIENLTKAIPPDVLEKIGKGIETFGTYLGSQEFQDNVKAFAGGVKWIAEKIISVGAWAGGKTASVAMNTASAVANSGSAWAPDPPGTVRDKWSGAIIKPGAGTIDPNLGTFAQSLAAKIQGIDKFTAFNDHFHKGRKSAHNDDRAFDLTIKDPSKSAEVADLIRKEMDRQGIRGRVIDEYRKPFPGSTGGHLHVQTDRKLDVNISNTPGSSIIVQTRQLVPPS